MTCENDDIQIPVSIKILGTMPIDLSITNGCFSSQQCQVGAWPPQPKLVTIWFFAENIR